MSMTKMTSVHHATEIRLATFVKGEGNGHSDFTVFKYGDDAERVSVMLSVEDTARLAVQFADAVARFRANGALPAEVS